MEEGRELPVGWEIARLEEIGAWGSGGTPKRTNQNFYTNGTIPWLVIGDLNDGLVTTAASFITEQALGSSAAKIVPRDSLLVAMYGSIGKLGITGVECATNQAIAHCKPFRELIELQYLFNALMHVKEDLISKGQGGAQQNISQGILRDQEIPLAPLNEQRRIAAKLDITLAAVDACRQRLDGVEALLKRFRQAVLAAATSGELTREWREENGVFLDSWQAQTIAEISSQVFDGPFGSHLKSDDYTSDGYRVVRLENLSHLVFLEEKRTYISEAKFSSLQRHVLIQCDILFSSFIDEEVRTCLLPSELSGISINKADCFCIRADTNSCLPEFLVGALSCRSAFEALGGLVHGATRPRINLKQLKSLSLQIPSIPEQEEIVRRAQQLFSLADQLEARLTAARKVVDRLTPALLAKAFRGELVPQDPNDEPASALLERIRAARQAEAAAASPSRRGRRKAAAKPAPSPVVAAPVSPDRLANLLRECGALSERALLAASELDPVSFQAQLELEIQAGEIRQVHDNGQEVWEVVA